MDSNSFLSRANTRAKPKTRRIISAIGIRSAGEIDENISHEEKSSGELPLVTSLNES